MTLVQVISPLLTKLECKLMRMRKKQPRFRMNCVAPLKATCGWPTWKCLWALHSGVPRQPHPDGPTATARNQLACEQIARQEAHAAHAVSRMLRGVVSNMYLLAKFSRAAGFTRYLGHAHYICACCLKSQINSSRPPSTCDLGVGMLTASESGQRHARGLCLGHDSFFVTPRSEWHNFSCHSSTSWSRTWGACQLLWM